MRIAFAPILLAGALGALLASSAAPALAKTARACGAEYAANRAALKAAGIKKADFLNRCLAETDAAAPVEESNPYQQQYLTDRRVCPPGTHSQTSAVSGNGYECVINRGGSM
jgi:hypothetical protein